MATQAYFENIQSVLIEALQGAQTSLHIAVAWLTDKEIIHTLAQKAQSLVRVQVLVADDDINRQTNFEALRAAGGKVWLVGKEGDNALMHNKFCVIDNRIVITGSYNWSRQAQLNYENITITDEEPALASQFIAEFEQLKRTFLPFEAIQKRLEILKNVIALQDEEDIIFQAQKLQKILPEDLKEVPLILQKIEQKIYSEAMALITNYLHQQTNTIDYELFALRFELHKLEEQAESLQEKLADIEKIIYSFEVRYRREVGDLLAQILLQQREKARKEAEAEPQNETKKQAYEQAEQNYNQYHEQHEATKKMRQTVLNETDSQTLKSAYRQASKLCHPDLVTEEHRKEAEETFIALDLAYKEQDSPAVQRILEDLRKGGFKSQATVNEKDKLRLALARLRKREEELLAQIFQLKASKSYTHIQTIGDWDAYFIDLKAKYEAILEQ